MKRAVSPDAASCKKIKMEKSASLVPDLTEDLLYEVLRRADERTLGAAACVSSRWRRLAQDERIWESVCLRHWAALGCAPGQLRSVVLALGGFRKLYISYLVPTVCTRSGALRRRWSRDELQMSLSMLSVGFFSGMMGGPMGKLPPGRGF
jgi:F-box protein GID2